MKTKMMILLSATALGLAACGQRDDNANVAADINLDADANLAVDNAAMTAAPMTAQGFVNAAAASDRFEVETSKLAASSAQSAAIKKVASEMISAHTASTAKLKSTAGGMSPPVTPDDTLNPEQQSTLDNLKTLKGADFDAAYAAGQVMGHQKTLDALNAYAQGGDNPTLQDFAKGMVPTVTAHLNMAKGLK